MFGAVQGKIRAVGGQEPDWAELSRPMEWDKDVVRVFCSGCGSVWDSGRDDAEALAALAGVVLPEDLDRYYFKINGCEACEAQMTAAVLAVLSEP